MAKLIVRGEIEATKLYLRQGEVKLFDITLYEPLVRQERMQIDVMVKGGIPLADEAVSDLINALIDIAEQLEVVPA